jgi:hypothetical protein
MSYTQTAPFSIKYVSYCIDLVILEGAFMAGGRISGPLRRWFCLKSLQSLAQDAKKPNAGALQA